MSPFVFKKNTYSMFNWN